MIRTVSSFGSGLAAWIGLASWLAKRKSNEADSNAAAYTITVAD
jgi:hypothetical protein